MFYEANRHPRLVDQSFHIQSKPLQAQMTLAQGRGFKVQQCIFPALSRVFTSGLTEGYASAKGHNDQQLHQVQDLVYE